MIQSIAIVKALSKSKVNIISRLRSQPRKGINSKKKNKSEEIVSKSTFVIRMETCTVCKNEWEHDKGSTLNMLYIAQRMLCGEKLPIWLS